MKTVAVVGASGMLGSMVLDVLARNESIKLIATVRSEKLAVQGRSRLDDVEWCVLDVEEAGVAELRSAIGDASWVINAIGITKPYIRDDNPVEIERAIKVNSLFPHRLAQAVAANGGQVLQIATDCVYSGTKGHYVETDMHDALDVYGKTKSLGETFLQNVHHIRCSIIGPEPKTYAFLLEWFRRQPKNAKVNGYTNHQWNGVTTLHFSRLCQGIITKGLELPHLQHVIPSGILSKYELLQSFAREYHREDITITPIKANLVIDRTLDTKDEILNHALWSTAGYSKPPSIPQMVAELAQYDYSMEGIWS